MPFTERSARTRAAILDAARELLVVKGYEAATIRGVAARAGTDPSMVMRYYGNKAGLFAAAVDVDLYLPDPTSHPAEQLGAMLAQHLVDRWEGAQADELLLLLRSAGTTAAAAQQIRSVFTDQVRSFVSTVTDRDADRRAAMISSQVLGVALCRYVLAIPAMAELDSNELIATLAPVLQHYLTGDLDSGL